MKKLALGLLLSVVVSGAAVAADMAPRYTKAPPPIVSPATNWSGFYIGAMGGYASENTSDDNIVLPGVVADPRMKGGFGGGTVGYNWQTGQFVFGLEADAAFGDIHASATAFGVTAESKIRSLGTVRGRVGMAFDTVLLYATGGYAWADNKFSITAPPLSFSESNFHHGWTVGAGVEWMFAPKWSVKFEYLYRDFGSETYFSGLVPGVAGIDSGSIGFHSGQVGVNFHF
jgi:outer membrane immunogenic protein